MRRALISVTDKSGIEEFARGLTELGFELVSTGNTHKKIVEAGLPCKMIDEITGFPEILDGRVKTLHPMVHGGLLFRRDVPEHVATIKKMGIEPIDLVCVNLYQFEKALRENKPLADMIENIDIGGPSMIRSAAKNFKDVLIVTDPADYEGVLEALRNHTDTQEYRRYLAYKAYRLTASYDAMISRYFGDLCGETFPDILNISLKKTAELDEDTSLYQDAYLASTPLDRETLSGPALTASQLQDLYQGVALVREFTKDSMTAVIKEGELAMLAVGDECCKKAPVSSGVAVANHQISKETAIKLKEMSTAVIAAPDYTAEAQEILSASEDCSVLRLQNLNSREALYNHIQYLEGQVLVQKSGDKKQ